MPKNNKLGCSYSTQLKLAKSLKELMANQPFEKLSVSDITNNCSLHRQTFYYHFADTYALMDWTLVLYGKPCRIRMWKNGCRNPTNKRKRIFI